MQRSGKRGRDKGRKKDRGAGSRVGAETERRIEEQEAG